MKALFQSLIILIVLFFGTGGAIAKFVSIDGNGTADFVWRNTVTGATAVWLMNASGDLEGATSPGGLGLNWVIQKVGDVNGDGQGDFVWRQPGTGITALWLMNSGGLRDSMTFPGGAEVQWEIKSVADVNNDGKADVVWRNTDTGATAVWLMNASGLLEGATFPGGAPLEWSIHGVGDVNGDGSSDFVWRNTINGATAIWMMNNLGQFEMATFPGGAGLEWAIRDVGDVNNDGSEDLVWRNRDSGATAVWLMTGLGLRGEATFPGGAGLDWVIHGVGDVNGNGTGDIVWRNRDSGATGTWLMNTSGMVEGATFPGGAPQDWELERTREVDGTLQCGSLESGSIEAAGEVDLFTFTGQTGDIVDVTIVETGAFTASRPRINVFAPSGENLGGFNANSQNTLVLEETGTFTIRVMAENLQDTGTYTLGLECRKPLRFFDETIACGGLLEGRSIEKSGEVDLITFEGQAGGIVDVTIVETGAFAASRPRINVFAPSGKNLGGFNANSQNTLALEETGTYTIRVKAENLKDTGSYNLGLECRKPLQPPDDTLACGGLLEGRTIEKAGEVDLITFEGQAGGIVDVTIVETGAFAASRPRINVFAPSGENLGGFNANSQNTLMLEETGTYTIRVKAENLKDTGSYNLGLECRKPLQPPDDTLTCGGLLEGRTIEKAGEVDLVTFPGQAGDIVDVTIVETGEFTASRPRINVFAPSGENLGGFNANSQNALMLEETGTYTIRVKAENLKDTGSYNLGLECR